MDPIEVEVLEIDGKPPQPPDPVPADGPGLRPREDEEPFPGNRPGWRGLPPRIRLIHPLWWPLILILGSVVLVLVLAIGLVFLVIRTILRLLAALFR